ncbi:PREDICTED: dual specificity protein phosphatase 19-like [Cyphomyrmex costatus]|uniref:dual specificity protein phosphatase 19-like n=1 Tax=Cyphomyrmex costatus TaxID=456900 RepID=UPI00085233E3|nr:PREDICTED: dual specificity protein phosphatase 19-like [Cyphomyrmex costatus]
MMDLRELIMTKKSSLKSCKTVIIDQLGNKYEIEHGRVKKLEKSLPFVVDEKPDLHVASIISGLYLGSQDSAVCIDILKKYEIRHILSIGVNLLEKYDDIQYHTCDLLDLPESDILPSIKKCIDIIHTNLKENILVHCNAGVSRSASIVIAYLMIIKKLSYDEAYNIVKRARSCIRPNDGFIKQLRSIENTTFL